MVVSPYTGQKVLAVQQSSKDQKLFRDQGKGRVVSRLRGDIGDRYNYVTLENYGKGEMYPVPIRNNKKTNNGQRRTA